MNLYLVRHAQAGDIKSNYDVLSEYGKYQSQKLGKYFLENDLKFDLWIRGTLNRHKETMQLIQKEMGIEQNELVLDCLDEISENTFKNLLKYYIEKDKLLQHLFKQLQNSNDLSKSKEIYILILKNIFKNWIYDTTNPISYSHYKSKVLQILEDLKQFATHHHLKNILIISSGTPISILLGYVFGLTDEQSLNWMKKIYNTSISVLP
jgi:broad specificity phosphatase PhoE